MEEAHDCQTQVMLKKERKDSNFTLYTVLCSLHCTLHKFNDFKGFTLVKAPCWKKQNKVAQFRSGDHFDKFQFKDCHLLSFILAKRLLNGCGTRTGGHIRGPFLSVECNVIGSIACSG